VIAFGVCYHCIVEKVLSSIKLSNCIAINCAVPVMQLNKVKVIHIADEYLAPKQLDLNLILEHSKLIPD